MADWYAVVDDSDGSALSFYTDTPDAQLPDPDDLASRGLVSVLLDHAPGDGWQWDAATRAMVSGPPVAPAPAPTLPTPAQAHERAIRSAQTLDDLKEALVGLLNGGQ